MTYVKNPLRANAVGKSLAPWPHTLRVGPRAKGQGEVMGEGVAF